MNTEQLARYLTTLEQIAANTGRIADALEKQADLTPAEEQASHQRLRVTFTPTDAIRDFQAAEAREEAENLNPKGPYA